MHKNTGTLGLFSEENRLEKLSRQGNPLERLNKVVNWEYFREVLEKGVPKKLVRPGPKPYDPVTMFKILILQRYYDLGDGQLECQILDRLTFCRFLGLTINDRAPDEKTICLFREKLVARGPERELFDLFAALLEKHGLIANEGKLIDASLVPAPRQRNNREENKKIKDGLGSQLWEDEPNKKRQKDTDARWTKKNNENHYGYKNHIKADEKHKFVDKYSTTAASVHDSQALEDLMDEGDKNQELWADSAYTVEEQEKTLKKYGMVNQIHEKGSRNHPLTEEQKQNNTEKSRTRARVEHIFGFMEESMNRLYCRAVGLQRANGFVGLVNLTYNLFRYEQLVRIDGINLSNWE